MNSILVGNSKLLAGSRDTANESRYDVVDLVLAYACHSSALFLSSQCSDTGIQKIQPQMSTLGSCITKAGSQCRSTGMTRKGLLG